MTIGQATVTAGWIWMISGIVLGMLIGLRAESTEWAGGYDSLRRRAMRLAHISAIALPLLAILYGSHIDSLILATGWKMIGAFLMMGGMMLMPIVCLATSVVNPAKYLFPLPATSILAALVIMAWGQLLTLLGT